MLHTQLILHACQEKVRLLFSRPRWPRTGLPHGDRYVGFLFQVVAIATRFVVVVVQSIGFQLTHMAIGFSFAVYRREGLGGHYLCGKSPASSEEPGVDNLDVDYTFFDQQVWPDIAKRVPAFENIKVFLSFNYHDHQLMPINALSFTIGNS